MRKALLITLVLLIVVVVAADRIGVRVAQNEIAEQVAAQYDLKKKPDVTIHGFPFLTQAIGGEYEKIDVKIGSWTEQDVTVEDVKVELTELKAPLTEVANGNVGHVEAGTATASALIPYDVVRQQAPEGVEQIAPKGSDLQVKGRLSAFGVGVDVTAVVKLKATSKGIEVTPETVSTDGGPDVPVALARRSLSFTVPVRDLPVGARISKVTVAPDGLRLSATSHDVTLNDLPTAS